MTATSLPAATRLGPRRLRGVTRRQLSVLVELLVAVAICVAGYYLAAGWFRVHEAAWVVTALHLVGVRSVSSVLPGHVLIFRPDGEILNGVVTTSCSSILTVVGLTALTVAVLRDRKFHAAAGLLTAATAVVLANGVRLALSVLAGLWWGEPSMVLFHDWVGTVWTLTATLGGFLLMVCITLPTAERAEQDVAGRHTARRPSSWARPGLGYRVAELEARTPQHRWTLTSFMHRRVLPRRVSKTMAARREAGRVDYRIGHKPVAERIEVVRALVADGLGAHTASLIAVATYEQDVEVLDALADAVAARQWEPITSERVTGLRLWARGWLLSRRAVTGATAVGRPAVPVTALPQDRSASPIVLPATRILPRSSTAPARPRNDAARSFARPTPAEDPR